MDLVALLPWWAGAALAVLTYGLLHHLASQPLAAPQPGQLSGQMVPAAIKGLATVGQYVAPIICLAGAVLSIFRRKQREKLVATVTQNTSADALDGMSWQEFELLVGEGFRLQGYQVQERGGAGADGGIDLILTKPSQHGGEKFLVQCKQWRAFKVGVAVVRELYGVMAAQGAAGGFVVTSGRFTDEAISFASGRNVNLIDGPQLDQLLKNARGATQGPTMASPPPRQSEPEDTQTLTCPLCSRSMVRRVAKRGANAGSAFWGCTGYPACRGTKALS